MARDQYEFVGGGLLRDRYGRRQLVVAPRNASPTSAEALAGGTVTDVDGREEVVLLNTDGSTFAGRIKSLTDYGADPTGVADSTSAINTALAAGSAIALDGTYRVDGVVTIPVSTTDIKDFIGTGQGRVTFKLGAAGQFRVGTRAGTGGATPTGGRIGNFTIDGQGVQSVAGGQLFIGLIQQALIENLTIKSGAGEGLVVEAAQNCTFLNLNVVSHSGIGVAIDYGAGGHTFLNPEVAYNGGGGSWNWASRQSGASPAVVYPTILGPSNNVVIGGRIEAPAQNALGSVLHAAGTDNAFIGVAIGTNWATGTTPDTVAAIKVQPSTVVATTVLSTFLTVSDCKLLGAGSAGGSGVGSCFEVIGGGGASGDGSDIVHYGGTMRGFSRPYRSTQADRITSRDVTQDSNGANLWTQKAGDTPVVYQDKVMKGADTPAVLFATVGYGAGASDGTVPPKYYRRGNRIFLAGTIQVANGTAANTTLFTLPTWTRPIHQITPNGLIINDGAFQTPSTAQLSIAASGAFTVNAAAAGLGGMQVVLDSITFEIGQ